MAATGDSEFSASLPVLSASPDAFLDAESSAASITDLTDLLGSHDFDPFIFESKDTSPEWLNDIWILERLPANSVPQLTREKKSIPVEYAATSSELESCQNLQGLCISLATGLLKSMHSGSQSCLLGEGSQDGQPQSAAVDAVSSAGQLALRTLRGLLKCPCYESPQLQLLVTVICAELIAWYKRIIDTYRPHPNTHTDSGVLLTDRVEALRRSFFIGDHCLEGHLETTLICQVLSCRLQELEEFIGDIAWNTGQSAGLNDEPRSCLILSAVHVRMDTFLNTQLGSVRRELLHLQDDTARAVPLGARD
ncbi:hypothetical protein DL764_002391 [Monosporascus ibericus]|uniref:Aflatoxin regulatory protein domain-containing protein n=1 Tax=Monosporascus ibericus TaxID=155417 RepID=A0A4Q4TQA0_9PEZI|nr:hypothetical protein DL764_002391 [Monosporascus ibericus]